jgi:F-type H+-transporting ATPase subunit epsilon
MPKVDCQIVTPEKEVFKGEVDMVIVPGALGEMGVLPNHHPLMSSLEPGEIRLKDGEKEYFYTVFGGFIEIEKGSRVVILADSVESPDAIDLGRAEEALERSRELVERARKEPDIDHARAEAAMRRAMVRLKMARKRRKSM